MPSELQEGALYPERILVGHPYNPSYILPLVEIVAGVQHSIVVLQCVFALTATKQ